MAKKKPNGRGNEKDRQSLQSGTPSILEQIQQTMNAMIAREELELPAGIEITVRREESERVDLLLKKGNKPFSNLSFQIQKTNLQESLEQVCLEIVEKAGGRSSIRHKRYTRHLAQYAKK